ncbi:HlyC/CorC family transporter [Chitinibacter sp. GC72]|uniref:HlyC/CorC family transporter n=1 Tax=Chitinibacter sp. GC72 TaxID=1526917 RepID=UPI0012FBB4EB|nr:transporter associated domain-containing protein [Chitinibacter sp. GC72]
MDDVPSPSPKQNWLERLTHFLLREPENRGELVEIMHSAFERHLLDADALGMIEGVLNVGDMQVRDVMVPRSQMDVIDINDTPAEFIPRVIATAHSRFPVIDGSKDSVVGILLAKDLLRYYAEDVEFNVRDMLRPVVYIPEAKRLNVLLKDFRNNRNHMAIVVDEYGGVAGLVTIEDVIEQIVGDIEDEFDEDDDEDQIIPDRRGNLRVKGETRIADLNEALSEHFDSRSQFSDKEVDTVAGLVTLAFGCVPKRGEEIVIDGYHFLVLRADSRRVHSVQIDEHLERHEIE